MQHKQKLIQDTKIIQHNYNDIIHYQNYNIKDDTLIKILDDINEKYLRSQGIIINRKKDNHEKVEFMKKINSYLNKITPQNSDLIINQFINDSNIEHYLKELTYLQLYVDMIYRKMITDMCYNDIYSLLIKIIIETKVYNCGNTNFRILFINKLQQVFEEQSIAKTSISNMILICNLYNNNIIAHLVIQNILDTLLSNINDYNIELLVTLIKNTNLSYDLISDLKGNDKLSSRIKFMILDLEQFKLKQ